MTNYEIYSLTVALFVFVLFAVVFSVMIAYITKTAVKLIRLGDDDKVIEKNRKYLNEKPSKASKFERAFSAVVSVLLVVIFVFSLCISCTENEFERGLSSFKVVKSDSMSVKNEKNEYLFENNLNDQFDVFDLVITRPLPAEDELELYDIVVYERDGMLVIHRIVGIEEPNDKHSERHFKLQGDAVSRHDIYPVLYSQMHAIYKGEHIPYVGSFITFLQSPAGWICFFLVLFAILFMPVIERKLINAMRRRLALLDELAAAKASAEPKEEMGALIEQETEHSPEKEKEQSPIVCDEPKTEKVPEQTVKEPEYIPCKRVEIPKIDLDKRTVRKAPVAEAPAREQIVLEKRKPIAPLYKLVPLEIIPPERPRVELCGDMAKNDNIRCHVVPIIIDGEVSGKFEIKPITRYTKLDVKCDAE